jgi:protein-ribulosamine 3-kinase
MDQRLAAKVEKAIARATGEPVKIAREEAVGGGSIGEARRLELADGRRFFLKSLASEQLPGIFAAEAAGLAALAGAGLLRVPRVLAQEEDFLLLELIEVYHPAAGFFEDLGHGLARLHRETRSELFGFTQDNYLGRSRQPNGWSRSWTTFWRDKRLGYQLALPTARGDRELQVLGGKLLDRLPQWLDEVKVPPSLLHGDLWAGNYLCGTGNQAVLVDPAVYYGHREAELAMTRLFGGFPPAFYAAYEEEWPLPPGERERGALYELYHLLNHYNLFGPSYRSRCLDILRLLA